MNPTQGERSGLPDLPEFARDEWPPYEGPWRQDVLPDGREVFVTGSSEAREQIPLHDALGAVREARGVIGLIASVLQGLGRSIQESDVVEKAQCAGLSLQNKVLGGTSDLSLAAVTQLMGSYEVAMTIEFGESLEDLAARIEYGAVVLATANAGLLFDEPSSVGDGNVSCLLAVTGVARDTRILDIVGFYVQPSTATAIARFVSAEALQAGWLDVGGVMAVSEIPVVGDR